MTTESNSIISTLCQHLPSISIVTESNANQENNIIKENWCWVLQSLLDSIAGWVGVIHCTCFCLCETERNVLCALVCHRRIKGDAEDEVTVFLVKVSQSSPGAPNSQETLFPSIFFQKCLVIFSILKPRKYLLCLFLTLVIITVCVSQYRSVNFLNSKVSQDITQYKAELGQLQ